MVDEVQDDRVQTKHEDETRTTQQRFNGSGGRCGEGTQASPVLRQQHSRKYTRMYTRIPHYTLRIKLLCLLSETSDAYCLD